MGTVENRTFDEIRVGDSAQLTRRLTMRDIQMFAVLSGDVNPAHLDEDYAKTTVFGEVIGHGMWGGALISTVLGTLLPGPGTIYVSQTLNFRRPVSLGERVMVKLTVTAKDPATKRVTLACEASDPDSGETSIDGAAIVIAPTKRIVRPTADLPAIRLERRRPQLQRLLELAEEPEPIVTAVVHPVDANSLVGAARAAEARLIRPVLVGPEHKIRRVADEEGIDLSPYEIVSTEHSHAAAATAVAMARAGKVEALMKGSLHTEELMEAALDEKIGLRTGRRMSHVYVMDVPTYPRPLFITDAAVNITPSLEEKRHIVQNAVDLAHALGIDQPRVAILSAVETVSRRLPSTLDAAALCKMAERGQITGALVDGPLAFDNAISETAAVSKGLTSPVAGRADILVVPDLEAGNMLAKELHYLADAESAGIVMGARVPIMLTSRADDMLSRMSSCALALLVVQHRTARLPAPEAAKQIAAS